MADYKIELGVKLNTKDISTQIGQVEGQIDSIKVNVDAETKELKKKIQEASKGAEIVLKIDTSKIESSLDNLSKTIVDIRKSLGTLDGTGMKDLVSSINQIVTALGKAENESDSLVKSLSALSKKDFSFNVGFDFGNSNKSLNPTAYGRKARKQIIPELQSQAKYLEDAIKQSLLKEAEAINNAARQIKYPGGKRTTPFQRSTQDLLQFEIDKDKDWGKAFNEIGDPSHIKNMEALETHVTKLKELASSKSINLDGFYAQHSKSATELINDVAGLENAVDKAGDVPEKLKNLFGSSVDGDKLSTQLDDIVANLNEIKTVLQGLSQNNAIDGLTQSFNKLSDTLEKVTANATLVNNAVKTAQQTGQKIGETISKSAKQSINLDDVIDKQVMKLMNEYAITGSKAFDEIKQSLVDFRSGTGDINKVTSAISNNMKVVNEAKNDYKELADYIKMFNASGAKVHIPDSIRQEYGDDYKSMRSQLGKGFTSGQGMDFETFITETNEILGQTIDLSHGAEAAFGDLVNKVNSTKGSKFLTGDDLFKNGVLDMGDVVANVSTSLEQIENAEEQIARTSTSVSNTVVQNEERTKNAYRETSGVIENLKTTLETMDVDRSSIDAVIKDMEELGFAATDTSVRMNNGGFDITVKGIDSIGRAITEIRHLDNETDEISLVGRKITQSFTETDKFVKQQKNAVADLTNQINQLNRAATDQNANRPIKDSSHLDSLKSKYQEIIAAIQKMGNTSSATFDDERNEVKRLINEYKSLKSEFKNAENVSMDFKGADFASGLEIAKNRLREFKSDAKGFSQVTQTVEQLDRAIEGVGDKSSLDKFNDQLRVAKSELKAVKAEVLSNNDNLANKIRIDIETEKFENKVSQLHDKLDRLSDVDGSLKNLRVAIEQVDDAYQRMQNAADDESLIQAQKEYAAAVAKANNELKIQTRIQNANNAKDRLKESVASLEYDMLNWLKKNSKATKEYKGQIDALINSLHRLDKADNLDQATVNGARAKFKNWTKDAEYKGLTGLNFLDSMKSKIKEYSVYFGAAELFMYAEQGLRSMFEQVKLIDSAMTELKKVTNETDVAYNNFLKNAATRSREIGTTIDGLVSSTADFARLGYGFEDAQGLAEVANIYAVVGDEIEGVEGATESLISTMAAFKGEMNGMSNTDFAMSIIDKFNEIGKLIA